MIKNREEKPAIKKKSNLSSKKNGHPLMSTLHETNVVDLILLDHKYLKECIATLTDKHADPKELCKVGKSFLDVLVKHSKAEEKTIYADLIKLKAFRSNVLESDVEHGIVDQKVKFLKPKLAKLSRVNDVLAAELKVCAELVKNHIRNEESDLLPKINDQIKEEERLSLGLRFAKIRNFSEKELSEFPKLPMAIQAWRNEMQDLSSKFVNRMDQLVDSFRQ